MGKFRFLLPALILGSLLIFPVFASSYMISFMLLTFMYITLASSWNLMSGYTGYISLGHGLFFGIGAYTFGLLVVKLKLNTAVALLSGGAMAVLVAGVIGLIILRVRIGIAYFAIVTLGLNEIIKTLIANSKPFGASFGITIPPIPNIAIAYYILLGLVVAVLLTAYAIRRSRSRSGGRHHSLVLELHRSLHVLRPDPLL